MDTELPSMNLNMMNQEFVKLDRFDGQNYSRWADKVKFLLAVLKLGYLLDPELPPIPANPVPEAGKQPDLKAISVLEKQRALRRESEQLCLGHIKNSLSDRLYDLYAPIIDPRELWKALELKYKTHEEGTNKYLVSKYLEYQMVDDRSIMEQVHELQVLVNKLTTLSIALPELFQVGAIISKLPPSWRDFSKRMMHKSEDYSLDDLLKHLRIEEQTRNRDKGSKVGSGVNFVSGGGSGQKGKHRSKNKKGFGPKKKDFKPNRQHHNNNQPKKTGKCHVCGETGHYARECSQRKSGPSNGSANVVEELTHLVANVGLGRVNTISSLTRAVAARGWFLDSGATVHVCGSESSFRTYGPVPEGTIVVCADGHRVRVHGKGTVVLKFRNGRRVTLQDVLHVPGISKGLISADKFDNNGYKLVIQNGRVEFTRNDFFVGQAINTRGMYRLDLVEGAADHEGSGPDVSVLDFDFSDGVSDSGSDSSGTASDSSGTGSNDVTGFEMNEVNISAYIACSISLWHKRLAHTNFKNIENMQSKGMLKFDNKEFEKCETCVKSKFTKKPFPSVKRDTSLLELIHSDICELNGILTRGGKRYFITFCDDSSRYLHVYLLRTKDEAFDAFKLYKDEVENQHEKHIKILRSDRGGEYFNREFDTFCEEKGIKHERTSPFTPQQNGLAERKNQTLVEMVNCMLNQSGLPNNLWGGSVINRLLCTQQDH
ncbi:hypothetical protein L1887_38933 [Cichorium endivia]|nr:hypothetical protein L1887_38933 [Cichorium endivia]